MKKFFVLFVFVLLAPYILGEQIFIYDPKDTEGATRKQIKGKSCQATRLKDNWYISAAHCFDEICKDTCVVEISGTPFQTTKKNVLLLNGLRTKNSNYDIALINFENQNIPKNSFKEPTIIIIERPEYNIPKIIKVNLKIPFYSSVIKSWDNVFYGPKSKIIFTQDMGLFHGLSGSGVFSKQGELIAITSATAGRWEDVKFSVFSVFDENVEKFLKKKLPTLYYKHMTIQEFYDIENLPEEEKNNLISLDRD